MCSKKKKKKKKPPPRQQQQTLSLPRLIRIGPNVNGKTHLWNPLDLHQNLPIDFRYNVLDFNQLSIVELRHVFVLYMSESGDSLQNDPYPDVYFSGVIAATCLGELQPLIVTFNESFEPCMFRSGDDGWMTIPNVSEGPSGDICNFKGRICVVDNIGRTVMVGPDLSIDFVADPLNCYKVRLCLVESELWLVDRWWFFSEHEDVQIYVYRLDEKKKKWVLMSNLGDRVLFLGHQCSFSASASDLGFANGNCVISMDKYATIKCGMIDLNLDESRILPLSDYPGYFKLLEASGVDREMLHWPQSWRT